MNVNKSSYKLSLASSSEAMQAIFKYGVEYLTVQEYGRAKQVCKVGISILGDASRVKN